MRGNATTNRIRRHTAELNVIVEAPGPIQVVAELPPRPDKPPLPAGDLSTAPVDEILTVVTSEFAHASRDTLADYRHGMRRLLELLADHAGATRQERWDSAGLNEAGRTVMHLADTTKTRSRLRAAAGLAFCLRLIQPSLASMRATNPAQYVDKFVRIARDPLLEPLRSSSARLV